MEAPVRQPILEQRYAELSSMRAPFLDRARKCSELTIPSLIPLNAGALNYRHNGGDSFTPPWQSMGARCVNNLASKLMLTQLPPNTPFFRLMVQPNAIPEDRDPALDAEIERGLSKMERLIINYASTGDDRVVVHEAFKHLIVGGNALLYLPPITPDASHNARCYHLSDYVTRRSPGGDVLEIIVHEAVTLTSLPEALQHTLIAEMGEPTPTGEHKDPHRSEDPRLNIVDIYTGVVLDEKEGLWRVRQEVMGHVVPGSQGTYPVDASPWIPMRFIRVDGEDYGRSYVEEYYGDLASLDSLYQTMVEGAAACAKVVFMVNPNSVTRVEDLAAAPNLGFVNGLAEDVVVLQMNKYADFRVTKEMISELERRLSHAFILNTAIQRDGERVTAEEIRRMSEDLEAALGGVYSLMAVEFQLPYIRVRMSQMADAGMLPELPEGVVKPAVVTGVEALGRGNDKTKLLELGQQVAQILGPQAMSGLVNATEYLRRLIAASGIDEGGLIVDPMAQQANQEQAMSMEMMKSLGPEALKQFGNLASTNPEALGAAMEGGMNNVQVPQTQ